MSACTCVRVFRCGRGRAQAQPCVHVPWVGEGVHKLVGGDVRAREPVAHLHLNLLYLVILRMANSLPPSFRCAPVQ